MVITILIIFYDFEGLTGICEFGNQRVAVCASEDVSPKGTDDLMRMKTKL